MGTTSNVGTAAGTTAAVVKPTSTFVTVRNDLEMPFEELYNLGEKAILLVKGSSLYGQLKDDVEAAWAELESISAEDLEGAVKTIGVAALSGLSTTGSTAGAIAAGIAAAGPAFLAVEADVSKKTTTTLVTSIVNSVSAAQTASAA